MEFGTTPSDTLFSSFHEQHEFFGSELSACMTTLAD